jgi:hypothetical protein
MIHFIFDYLIRSFFPFAYFADEEELSICLQRATARAKQVRILIDSADNSLKNYETT